MSKGKNNNKKKSDKYGTVFSIVFLLCIVLMVLFIILKNSGLFDAGIKGNAKVDIRTGERVEGIKEYPEDTVIKDTIDIPGYEVITFRHGTTQQESYFYNPEGNTCYFKMSLMLEDGTVIWQSDYLEPGVAYENIELNQKLEKGRYANATLLYNTYSLKDYTQLNGSSINLVIDVK